MQVQCVLCRLSCSQDDKAECLQIALSTYETVSNDHGSVNVGAATSSLRQASFFIQAVTAQGGCAELYQALGVAAAAAAETLTPPYHPLPAGPPVAAD